MRGYLLGFSTAAMLLAIPLSSDAPELGKHGFRNPISDRLMQTQAESHATDRCQRHIISRQFYALKAVVLLKLRKTTVLLLTVGKFRVNKIGNTAIRAGPNSLR